jgi:hypothetical protein
MVRVFRRINSFLYRRANELRKASEASPKNKALSNRAKEAAKDHQAYNMILEVCENLSSDVMKLRDILDDLTPTPLGLISRDIVGKNQLN